MSTKPPAEPILPNEWKDSALEHGEYLATAAERLIDALGATFEAKEAMEEFDDEDSEERLQAAVDDELEAIKTLRNRIHHFRTRRERAMVPRAEPSEEQRALSQAIMSRVCWRYLREVAPQYLADPTDAGAPPVPASMEDKS